MPGVDLVRGLTDIPLSGSGKLIAHETGIQFARRGGLDCIKSSALHRCIQTALIYQAHNPKAKFNEIVGSLDTLGVGGFEGREKSPEIAKLIDSYIKDFPNRTFPCPSPQQRDRGIPEGEKFNHFKNRVLSWVQASMEKFLMCPDHKEAWVTHHRVLQLMRGWIKLGCPRSFEIDVSEVLKKSGIDNPGQVERLWFQGGKWHMEHEDMKSLSKLKNAIYPSRHSFTIWNSGGGLGAAS